jgi:hypothetical protein
MPFYGKVKEVITCGSYVQSRTRYSLIVDGQNYPFGPCQNWTCGGYPLNCYCVGGNPQKEVSDVSQGTLIQTIFEKCISDNGKDYYWQTLEYEFQYVSETSYRIIVTKLEGGTADIGSITFTPTTPPPPPDCGNEPQCTDIAEAPELGLEKVIDSSICSNPQKSAVDLKLNYLILLQQ